MTKRNTAIISISLPGQMLNQINQLASLERKSRTELIKEAWNFYRAWKLKKDVKELRDLGEQTRKKFGFKTEDELYEYIHSD